MLQNPAIASETILPLSKARKALPGLPSPVAYCTIFRWCHKGLRNRSLGSVVTLEWCMCGGTPCTSVEAYQRFIEKLNRRTRE